MTPGLGPTPPGASGPGPSRERRKAARRAARAVEKARAQRTAAQAAVEENYREQHRQDRLPPGVWVVETYISAPVSRSQFAALRVSGPGQVDLWHGGDSIPVPIPVADVKIQFANSLRLHDGYGGRVLVTVLAFGEAGMADVGHTVDSDGFGSGGGDALDAVALILYSIWKVYKIPSRIARRRLRRRTAEDIRAAIQGRPEREG